MFVVLCAVAKRQKKIDDDEMQDGKERTRWVVFCGPALTSIDVQQ